MRSSSGRVPMGSTTGRHRLATVMALCRAAAGGIVRPCEGGVERGGREIGAGEGRAGARQVLQSEVGTHICGQQLGKRSGNRRTLAEIIPHEPTHPTTHAHRSLSVCVCDCSSVFVCLYP